jgi:hypothetical protein
MISCTVAAKSRSLRSNLRMKIRKLKETVQEYNLRDRKLILKAKCQSPSLAELLTRKKTTQDLSEIISISKVELTPLIPRKMFP